MPATQHHDLECTDLDTSTILIRKFSGLNIDGSPLRHPHPFTNTSVYTHSCSIRIWSTRIHGTHARTHDIHIHTVNIPKAPQRARPLYSATHMRYIDGTHEGGGVVGDDDGHQTSPQINAHTRTIFSKSHILIFRIAEMLQYTYTHTRSVRIGSTRGQQPSPTTRACEAKQRGDYVALN